MLASTVQFSNNKHTHTTPNPPTPHPPKTHSLCTTGTGMSQGMSPPPKKHPAKPRGRLFFQDPTGCHLLLGTRPTHEHHRSTRAETRSTRRISAGVPASQCLRH